MDLIKKKELSSAKYETDILTGMVVSSDFLKLFRKTWYSNCFEVSYINTVAFWCINYFDKHQKAPGPHLQQIFENEIRIDPNEKERIQTFLGRLSKSYVEADELYNADFHSKKSKEYIAGIWYNRLAEDIQKAIKAKDYPLAEKLKNKQFNFNESPAPRSLIYDDSLSMEAHQDDKDSILFSIPGEIGKLIGPIRKRGLYTIAAGFGVGKSWFLSLLGILGFRTGCLVLKIELEMTNAQSSLRVQSMLTGFPVYESKNNMVYVPIWDCKHNLQGTCSEARGISCCLKRQKIKEGRQLKEIYHIATYQQFDQYREHEVCLTCRDSESWSDAPGYEPSSWYKEVPADLLTPEKYFEYINELRDSGLLKGGDFLTLDFPRGVLGIPELKEIINEVNPGVVIIDYPEEMKMKGYDERKEINQIFGSLKGIAQENNIAIIEATQINDDGKVFGSRFKNHIIDGGIQFHQTLQEKDRGIMRCRSLKRRFGKAPGSSEVFVLTCFDIGKPLMDSWSQGYKIESSF